MLLHDKAPEVTPFKACLVSQNDVIIFFLWHLGDILNSTALLPYLSAKHKKRLTFVTTTSCAPILQNSPYLDKILTLDMPIPDSLSFADYAKLQRLPLQLLLNKRMVYNLHIPIDVRKTSLHIVECWANALGIEKKASELNPRYYPTSFRNSAFGDERVLVLGNGGATGIKRWPTKKWNMLVRQIEREFPALRIIQIGALGDPSIAGTHDFRGKTTIDESFHILKSAKFFLTNDSFLAHLAAVSGCNTLVMYGNTSPKHFRPLGNADIITLGGDFVCTPCLKKRCPFTLGIAPCLALPSVAEVFGTLQQQFRILRIFDQTG